MADSDLIRKGDVLKLIEGIKCDNSIPKNYGTLLDIMRSIRRMPSEVSSLPNVTNGDKLRSLSDEEMADMFMRTFSNSCCNCPISSYHKKCKPMCESQNITIHMACKLVCLEWLQSKATCLD